MKLLFTLLLTLPLLSRGQEAKTVPYVQNDKFVSNAFGFPASVKNFKKNYNGFLSISKKPVKNVYDESVVDTIYTFSSGKTKIEVYHAKDRDILQSAFIETDKIPLKYNIKVGDTKKNVAKLLKAKITVDKVQVGDLEQGHVYTFTFFNDELISISYDGYIE